MLSQNIKKHLGKLTQKKYRKEFDECVVEGVKGVSEAMAHAQVVRVIVEIGRENEPEFSGLLSLARRNSIPVDICDQYDISDLQSTETFPGVLAIVKPTHHVLADLMNAIPVIILDGVRDPGNLGTIIRTADWFGIENIIISSDSVDPYNDKCVRSSMGSIFRVKVFPSADLLADIQTLKDDGYRIKAISMQGTNISEMHNKKKDVYLFGSESHGIRPEITPFIDEIYSIPGKGKAESLNLAVATGIVLAKISL